MSASSLAAPASRTGPPAGAADAGAADSGGYAGAAPVSHSTSVPINKAISSSSSVLKFCNWASDCRIYSFLANWRCNSRYGPVVLQKLQLYFYAAHTPFSLLFWVNNKSGNHYIRGFFLHYWSDTKLRNKEAKTWFQYLSQSDFKSAIPLYISNPRPSVLAIPSCALLYRKTRSEIETGHLSFAPLHKKDKRSENDVWKTKYFSQLKIMRHSMRTTFYCTLFATSSSTSLTSLHPLLDSSHEKATGPKVPN